jgi:hypothetical protein
MRRVLANSERASAHPSTTNPCERDQFFAMGLALEKRVRSALITDVLFPSLTFPVVEYHCKYVRPAIREKGRESRFEAFSSSGCEERIHDLGLDISGARQTCSIVQHDFEDEEMLLLHT